MKSSYELAMERLNKSAPTTKLSEVQKREIADLESLYASKIAERQLSLNDEISKAQAAGEFDKIETFQEHFQQERKKFQGELEEKKEAVRQRKAK